MLLHTESQQGASGQSPAALSTLSGIPMDWLGPSAPQFQNQAKAIARMPQGSTGQHFQRRRPRPGDASSATSCITANLAKRYTGRLTLAAVEGLLAGQFLLVFLGDGVQFTE